MLSIAHCLTLPRICLFCDLPYKKTMPICPACEKKMTPLPALCYFCSEPTLDASCHLCLECQYQASNIRRIFVFYEYKEPLRTLITDFKFHHGYDLLSYLSELFLSQLPAEAKQTQCLIPVPLHRKKQAKRGYHQTHMLAKSLGKKLKIPVSLRYCQKIIETASQSQLNRQERQQNLKDAFQFLKPPFQKITLIDDIITTGSTIQTVAQGFQKLGVEQIDVWCLAKSIK
jgi:ComF family protein